MIHSGYGGKGLPGDYLTSRNPYIQMLLAQKLNNGTTAGGIGNIIAKGMAGYMAGQDRKDATKLRDDTTAAQRAFTQGAGAQPWVNPDTGSATIPQFQSAGEIGPPNMVPTAPAGGYAGAQAALAGLSEGNAAAVRLSANLMGKKIAADEALKTSLAKSSAAEASGMRSDKYKSGLRRDENEAAAGDVFNFAKSQEPGLTYKEFQARNKSGGNTLTANIGGASVPLPKPEAGFFWKLGPDGKPLLDDQGRLQSYPIPGSKAGRKIDSGEDKKKAAQVQKETYGAIVLDDADRAISMIEDSPNMTSGLMGSIMEAVPGTDSHGVAKLILGIKANIGFDRLQQMRAASPTGGALGAVSDKENALLQAAYGDLSKSVGSEQLLYNLNRFKKIFNEIVNGPGAGGEKPADPSASPATSNIRRIR